jgi:hypothetical protein
MTSSIQVDLHAYAWNLGEQPVEVFANSEYDGRDDDRLRHSLMDVLLTKEFGKFSRIYPGNVHVEASELSILYRAFTDQYRGRIIASGTDQAELDESFVQYKKYCEQKVFTPGELYALKPTRVDYGSYHTLSVHLTNEVDTYDLDSDAMEASKRFETRTIVDHDYDGRRGWTLQTVWFDGKPVMVVNNSGRDGDEYHDRWITDGEAFGKMVAWLRTFQPESEQTGFAEASQVIPAMTEFYNHTIHDYYDVEQEKTRQP